MGTSNAELLHLVDTDIEAMVLGTVLRSGESAFREISFLDVDDFALEKHRLVFRAMSEVAQEVHPTIDTVSLRLQETGKIEAAGGLGGLVDLDAAGIPGISLLRFGRGLRAKANDRRAWKLSAQLSRLIESGCNSASPEVRAVIQELAQAEPAAGSSVIVRIADLPPVGMSQEPILYIREPELALSAIVGLTGDSGSGKSTLATAWIRDAMTQEIPVLVLDRENPRPVALDRMNRLGLADSPLLRWYGGWNGETPAPASRQVLDWVRSCDRKPLVIVDSLIAFLGGDENDASVMRGFMNGARQLTDMGATVIIIHHDGKSTTAQDFRGSSDYKAALDQAFHVTNISSDGKLDRLSLRCYKSRYGFSGSLIYSYAGGRFLRDERLDAPARTTAEQLTSILRTNPGVTSREFDELSAKCGPGRSRARDFLDKGVLSGVVRREKGARNVSRHYLVEAD